MKILQDNSPGNALTDVNGVKMIFSAVDPLDKGPNGTEGMTYSVIGDGKFCSDYLLQLWHLNISLYFIDNHIRGC
jgi:hypothetical protein